MPKRPITRAINKTGHIGFWGEADLLFALYDGCEHCLVVCIFGTGIPQAISRDTAASGTL